MAVVADSSAHRLRSTIRRRPGDRGWIAPLLVAMLVGAFLIQCGWWIANDGRVPDFDTARHVGWALDIRQAFGRGDLLYAFNTFTPYPPLVHTVGALGMLLGGVSVGSAVLVADALFIPLLALSLYRTGRLMGSRWAGVLAVVFALGAPMLIAEAHAFLLELPEMALVAATLWALVASQRFSRPWPALAAGVACGLGVITKPTFPFFVAGAIAVAVARGGFRNRRGLALFVISALVVGGPWYFRHFSQVGSDLSYTTQMPVPPRFSFSNATWFTWDQINGQLLLPLYALSIVGAVWSVWGWRRRGLVPTDHTPELVIGGVVAYLGLTYGMSIHAPYYSLPALPYEALLGTVWIPALGYRARIATATALCVVAAVNIVAVGIHSLGRGSIRLPGQPPAGFIQPRRLTFWRSNSWPVGPPKADGRLLDLFRALHAHGVQRLEVDSRANRIDFDVTGVVLLARIAGLSRPQQYAPNQLGPRDVFVVQAAGRAPWPACRHLADGSGVFVLRREPGGPLGFTSACPSS